MRNDLIAIIVNRYAKRVADLALEQPVAEPAPAHDLELAKSDAKALLGAELDPAYLYLAHIADGIGADGSQIYATARRCLNVPGDNRDWFTTSIIQENLDWRTEGAEPKEWLIYGMGELEFIIQHLPTGRFQLRARGDWKRVIRDFATFEELLWEVLRYALELGEFPADRSTQE